MQLIASYPYLELYLHQGPFCALEAQWTGIAASAQLRRATLDCVELARAHGITGWIADDRLLGPISPVDLSWISTYVFPLLVQGGVRRFARLEAVDPRTQQALGLVQKVVQQQFSFELRSFTSSAQARAWACGELVLD